MMRYILRLLDKPTRQHHEQVRQELLDALKKTNIEPLFGFSANVGEHGGFITEHRQVYEAIQC